MAVFTSVALGGAGLFSLGSGLFASVSAIALNAAVGIGLSLAAQALAGQKQESTGGVRGSLQAGGDVPRSIVLGRRATAGSLVYANTWGSAGKTPNAYLVQVIALADAPVKALNTLYVNGEKCTVEWASEHPAGLGHPVTEYRAGGKDYLWVRFYDGTQTSADSYLVNTFSGHATRPYANTRVGTGVAYAVMTSRVNPELFSGFPAFRFELSGMRLYDPSKDTTAGGSGAQRWDNPATWGGDGDDLPAVQIYNLMRGIRVAGTWLYGLQTVAAGQLPATHWIGEIAKCRLPVAGLSGNEAQYLTSAEITVDTEIGKAVETFLTGCHGRLSETGGIYKLRVGEPGAPVLDISDGDILSTEEQSYVPFFGLAETVNGISASYPEPEEGWNTKAAPPLYNAGYEAQDGGRRLLSDVPMEAVYRSSQVQRLMASALAEARRARRQTVVLPPFAQVLEPGDVIRNTSPRNGFSAKLFRIDGVTDRANLDVMIDITEVDPTDYDPPGSYKVPVFSPLGPVRPGPQVMGGWSVVPSNIDGKKPAILVSCDADIDDVARVWVQVRLKASGAVVFDSDSAVYADPYAWLLSGAWCLSVTTYQVRGKYVPYSKRQTAWSDWLDVTTGLYAETDFTATLQTIGDDVRARFEELAGEMDNYLRPTMERLAVDFSLMAAASQIARESLLAEAGASRVEIIEEKRVRASETEALGQLYTALQANFNANIASVQSMLTVLVNADTAMASSISQLSADVAGNTAAITNEQVARANADGALASEVSQLWASTNNSAAAITTEASARSSADEALSTLITSVQATADAAAAAVVTEQTARADADGALASSVSSVSADFDGRFAQGLIKFEARAAPSGVDARFAVLLRGGTGQSFKVSGLYVDLYTQSGTQKGRVAVLADQFVVTDGNNTSVPLVFESSQLKVNAARFGTVTSGVLRSPDGKMVINLAAGTIVVKS